jgi:CRP/FNR family transcriptional regulator
MFAHAEAAPIQHHDASASAHHNDAEGFASLRGTVSSIHAIAPDATLFRQGDCATHLFQVEKGVLRLCRLMSDGRRSIIGFAYPGDVIGIAVRDVYAYSAEAVSECELLRFSTLVIRQAMERSSAFTRQMLVHVSSELCAAQDQMLLLGRKTATERVASFLLALAQKQAPGARPSNTVDLPMPRPDIADYLGLTTETVCRIFTKLKQAGILCLPSAHLVKLIDGEALRRLAEDSESLAVSSAGQPRTATWPLTGAVALA